VPVFKVRNLNYELPRPSGRGLNWEEEKTRDYATPQAWRNRGADIFTLIFPWIKTQGNSKTATLWTDTK